jgi:hypothetical protein
MIYQNFSAIWGGGGGPWKTRKHRKHYIITVNTKKVTENTYVSSKIIVHTLKYVIPNFYAYRMRIEGAVAYFQTSFICTISHYEICRVVK